MPRIFRAWLLLLVVAAIAAGAVAQEPKRVEVPNAEYSTPEKRAAIANRLDRPDRDSDQKPEQLVAALGIKPGDRVADIGTGTGYMLPFLSKAVGSEGAVFAEDIFPDFLERAKKRAEEHRLTNVRFFLGDEKSPKLPAAEADIALLLDAYHHFEFPKVMLDNIRAALKPGGRLAIVDFYKRGGMSNHVRLDKEGIRKEVESFGWKLVGSPDALPNQYILIFRPE